MVVGLSAGRLRRPVSALEFNENIATLSIRPGAKPGDPAGLELPPDTGLSLVRHVTTAESGSVTVIAVDRLPDRAWLDVRGTIAVDAAQASRDVAVATPTLYFTHALTLALAARGIQVRGIPRELVRSEYSAVRPEASRSSSRNRRRCARSPR